MRTAALFAVSLVFWVWAAPAPGGAGEVTEASLSTNVVDRNPKGVSNEFSAGVGRIYCFTKVVGMEKGEVIHRWVRQGKTQLEVALKVDGAAWRVWSAKSVSSESLGPWKVEVLDSSDRRVLKTLEFVVKP